MGSLIQQPVLAVGWFRRGICQQVDLKRLEPRAGGRIASYTAFWGKAGGVLVMLVGILLAVGGAIAAM